MLITYNFAAYVKCQQLSCSLQDTNLYSCFVLFTTVKSLVSFINNKPMRQILKITQLKKQIL